MRLSKASYTRGTPASGPAYLQRCPARLHACCGAPFLRSNPVSGDAALPLPFYLQGKLPGSHTWKWPPHRRFLSWLIVPIWCLGPGYQSITSFGASVPDCDIINFTYIIHFIGDEFTVTEALKKRKCLFYCIWNLHFMSFEVTEYSLIDQPVICILVFCGHPGEEGYCVVMIVKALGCW